MRTYASICLGIPRTLLPKPGLDLTKWAVIACDQFTSEPDYWQKVSDFIGEAPSTLNLIYPEIYLGEKNPQARITRIREYMERYMDMGLWEESEGFIYVEREVGPHIRKGLIVCLDLEGYDFHKGSTYLIRSTEGTILERIPPRVRTREGAPIELPHIMVLIDDPQNTVIGPLTANREKLKKLYDFELMMRSGHLSGYKVDEPGLESNIIHSLEALAEAGTFSRKYDLSTNTPVLLYAMGDGNHSLATAKTIWEKAKKHAPDSHKMMNSPLRYALVELVNLHDEALIFEPIHRVLFGLAQGRDLVNEMEAFYPTSCSSTTAGSLEQMKAEVDSQTEGAHNIGLITPGGFRVIKISSPASNLPVGTLQNFLDVFLKNRGAEQVDYVHGTDVVLKLGQNPGNMGFYLPAMKKQDLFKTVILDGALPRKTFSMGEAWEKRFYMEARKLF
ncbi:MAG: DUF1015 domain-containing protein [Candidatus Aminicenantales bacterium]